MSDATTRRVSAVLVLLGLSLLYATAGARAFEGEQRHDRPPVPYEDHGACPFECCSYRAWTVKTDTDLRVARSDASPLVVRLRKGDRAEGVTGVVITTRLGTARVLAPITKAADRLNLNAGEMVDVLNYVGEGAWKLWVKGKLYVAEDARAPGDCDGPEHDTVLCPVQIVEKPTTVWWAKVRTRKGQEGWTRQLNHFGNIDACG